MAKTSYKNLVTVPDAATDNIVSSPNTGVGGDIVANFKAIANVINPTGSTGCQALNVGCNFSAGYANAPTGAQYHILNNTGHAISSWLPTMAFGSDDQTPNGMQSGAFMKGVLLDMNSNFPTAGYKLIDVPYYGGMIVNLQILIIDCEGYIHAAHGTIVVYPQGVHGTGTGLVQGSEVVHLNPDGDRSFGTFEVLNGDLIFKSAGIYDGVIMQIGMHGTILTGSFDDVNSAQASSTMMPYYSV